MTHQLPPDLESYVADKIASGQFGSREEFAVEAARVFRDLEIERGRLKSDIQAALDEANQGLCQPLDIESIKAELIDELDEYGHPK